MKREWTGLEFADWTLLPSEAALLANNKTGATRLGFAEHNVLAFNRDLDNHVRCLVKPLLFIPIRQPKNVVVPGRQVERESRGEEVVPMAM